MPQKCIINECQSVQRKNCGISFFKFPLNDKILLEKWTVAIHKTHCPVTACSRICERHFKKEFLSGKERKRLKINAIPTELLTLQVDPLQELNALINLYGQGKTGCKEKMAARRDTSSSICNMDAHVAPDPVEEMAARRDTSSSICNMDAHVAPDPVEEMAARRDTSPSICNMDAHVAPDLVEEIMYINKCAPTNEADDSESQIKTLKVENKRLTALVQSLRDNHIKQLQNQADMFQHLLREQKDFMKNKLTAALTKVKLLNRQKQRLNVKMIDLLKEAKSKKILHEESYDILSSEFEATFKYIIQNEKLNKNKACYGRRYNEEKTLYITSSKFT
ncbi:uncharacterized protein [Polyergus mexicanus]|uniref:uncharacterized protein n=1 Tax=Polyergus mexicanus TaxID=615972 RepID=UPI0038B47409